MNNFCDQHFGFEKEIENLKKENDSQWQELKEVRSKVDSIIMRLNVILGGLVVGILLLAFNIAKDSFKL